MPLTLTQPSGQSPHPYAPYRTSEGHSSSSPRNALFVASNGRMADSPSRTDGTRHAHFDVTQTKYDISSWGQPRVTQDTGTLTFSRNDSLIRNEPAPRHLTPDRFERVLDDALRGVAMSSGRVVAERVFAGQASTADLLDTIKGSELLVQIVREGQLTTKIIDKSDVDPVLASALEQLNE